MQLKRIVAVGLSIVLVSAPLAAAGPAKSPYADLLPANTTLQDSPDRLDPGLLSCSMLGVVPSSRYVARTARWQGWFGEKGEKGPGFHALLGLTRTNNKLGAEASDPKRVVDATLLLLRPRFGEVKLFDDLAAARDGGARYFLILDFNQSVPMNFGFGYPPLRGWAGALLLDGSFRRVAEVAVERKTKWYDTPLLGMSNAYMMTFAKSHDENFKALLPAFTEALNAALTERGSPMPIAAPFTTTATLTASTGAPGPMAATVDEAFRAQLAAVATAGTLYAIGDEMAEKGERAKASAAFRAILTRFPNDPLAAKAADRLSAAAR